MLCFPYAVLEAMRDKSVTVIHGFVTLPCSQPPQRIKHAWIEKDGIVRDYQTMCEEFGGIYHGQGYPVAVFNELFQPERVKVYTAQKAVQLRQRHHHCGPWEDFS